MTFWSAPEEPEQLPDLRGRPAPRWPVQLDGRTHHYHDDPTEAALCAAELTMEEDPA